MLISVQYIIYIIFVYVQYISIIYGRNIIFILNKFMRVYLLNVYEFHTRTYAIIRYVCMFDRKSLFPSSENFAENKISLIQLCTFEAALDTYFI